MKKRMSSKINLMENANTINEVTPIGSPVRRGTIGRLYKMEKQVS